MFQTNNVKWVKYLFGYVFLFTIGASTVVRLILIVYYCFGIDWLEFSIFLPRINVFTGWDSFALIYFIMGGIIYKYWIEFSVQKRWIKIVAIFAFICVVAYGYYYMYGSGNYYSIVWNSYPSASLFFSAVIWFVTIINSTWKLPRLAQKIIRGLARNTMGVYFVHLVVGTLSKPAYLALETSDTIIAGLLYAIIIFTVSNLICEIIRKVPLLRYMINL